MTPAAEVTAAELTLALLAIPPDDRADVRIVAEKLLEQFVVSPRQLA